MNSKQKLSLVFLVLGFIFSSVVRVRFNVSNGFDFQNFWITIFPTILDFAAFKSNDLALTSTFVGYLFLVISGLFMLDDFKALRRNRAFLIGFMVLALFAFLFELVSIIQDLSSSFNGQHLRIGFALFLIGISVFIRNNLAYKE